MSGGAGAPGTSNNGGMPGSNTNVSPHPCGPGASASTGSTTTNGIGSTARNNNPSVSNNGTNATTGMRGSAGSSAMVIRRQSGRP